MKDTEKNPVLKRKQWKIDVGEMRRIGMTRSGTKGSCKEASKETESTMNYFSCRSLLRLVLELLPTLLRCRGDS